MGEFGAARVKSGPAFWHCREPRHFQDQSHVMGRGNALVESGYNPTLIHQSLVQGEALGNACLVKVRSVYRDVREYLLVPIIIKFREQKHIVEVAVGPRLTHSLILGANWPEF